MNIKYKRLIDLPLINRSYIDDSTEIEAFIDVGSARIYYSFIAFILKLLLYTFNYD